jgi:hypothetical protein
MTKSKKTDWKDERPVYLLLAIAGAIIAIFFYFIPKNSRDIDETKLVSVNNIVLSKDPEVVKRRHLKSVRLHIKDYDKPFTVAGFDFSENIKRSIIRDIKSGDTISIKTEKSEFDKIDEEPLLDGYTAIKSLNKNGQEYLNIKQANNKARSDLELGILVGLYLLVVGLIYWSFKTRPTLSPTYVIGGGLLAIILMM